MKNFFNRYSLKEKTKYLNIYNISDNKVEYNIGILRKHTDKKSWIDCKDENITLRKAVFGIYLHRRIESFVICIPDRFIKRNCCNIIIIKGKIGAICGLDEGIIASSAKISNNFNDKKLYIMTKKEFIKIFCQI